MEEPDELEFLAGAARNWQYWAQVTHQHCENFSDEPETVRELQEYRANDSATARSYLFKLLKAQKGK